MLRSSRSRRHRRQHIHRKIPANALEFLLAREIVNRLTKVYISVFIAQGSFCTDLWYSRLWTLHSIRTSGCSSVQLKVYRAM